ncbi:hypothetical protein [Lacticaseibacillus chiayiensis]|nr:hypothetical protein [Lacticaseibacillus chiayiensis]QVI35034.1 hypothetical protein KG086_01440 [Lacticaseibacillus chiayiensis]RXT55700.1 hypothetical protein CHT97_12085 [Lacticaseibacillus chiayiensis]UYN56814.1 hypothetical protein OFW50_01550 [Lacticaseibacillus chiayiensis]
MSQAELNSIQDTINTFVSSPIPNATLYFTDIETITATLQTFGTTMYMQTPKRWTPEAFETLLADIQSTLPALGFQRYKQVMKLAVTTLADEEKLSRKQAMALLQVL